MGNESGMASRSALATITWRSHVENSIWNGSRPLATRRRHWKWMVVIRPQGKRNRS